MALIFSTHHPYLCRFFGLLVAISIAHSGCSKSAEKADSEISTKIIVVATAYPMAAVARAIGGEHVDVKWFCEYGQDPRNLKPSSQQLRLARNSDLIITSGYQDNWAGADLGTRQKEDVLIRPEFTATGVNFYDEHTAMWLHPQIVKETANVMRERFMLRDVKHADEFKAAYEKLAKEIDQIDAEYKAAFAKFKIRKFVSIRPVWDGLCKTYGLEEIAPINTSPHKVTDAEIAKLKKAAVENQTNILAIDAATLPGVQRDLELRTGMKLMLLDNVGSSAPDANSTWPKLMRYNLEQFEKMLK